MLPTDLLVHHYRGEMVVPKRLPLDSTHRTIAAELIDLFREARGDRQGVLDQRLQALEGDQINYRLKRGLAHILRNAYCTFDVISPLEPIALRRQVFAQAAQFSPSRHNTERVLRQVARTLSQDLDREIQVMQVQQGLYADLVENRILTHFEAPEPDELLYRYNLNQIQGVCYRATHLVLHVHRNDPGEYKLLFRYLKLFRLMTYIEGDADHGFTITVDGPASLFKPSTCYGLDLAKLIPALLHVTRWDLELFLSLKDPYSGEPRSGRFMLNHTCGLVSHYPPGKPYDSLLEASFAKRWSTLHSPWRLEREVELIPVPGSVIIPDFRLVHPDGRVALLEIVGYWRPEYLRKKFAQARQCSGRNLVLAVSERLNLEKAGVSTQNLPVPVVWFKEKLLPKSLLPVLETIGSSENPSF